MSHSFSVTYQNTLMNLYAGVVGPIDREVLSYSPLPSDIVDPYAAQDVDPANTMNLTYSAMAVWIDEAKKANYFSKHFVTLSKMIMNGTTTMARGLVTMHARGENLGSAPMSIGDLISLSSYHFRKSYLGVIQTAKSQPEISERLLLNQLGWCNTLMRLFKTKEKLEKPVAAVRTQRSEEHLPGNEQEPLSIEETADLTIQDLKAATRLNEGQENAALTLSAPKAQQGVSALGEPGAFTAAGAYNVIRAFTSFDHTAPAAKKSSRAMNTTADKAAFTGSKKRGNEEALMSKNESASTEAVQPEKQVAARESQPDMMEQAESEIRTSGNDENVQKESVGTKETITDSPKAIKPEANSDAVEREQKKSESGIPGMTNSAAPKIPDVSDSS